MSESIQSTPIVQQSQNIGKLIIDSASYNMSNSSHIASSIVNDISIQQTSEGMGFAISLIIGLFVILVLYFLIGKKKSSTQNVLALIGERYSGKTQLFIHLTGGKIFQTVPSIKNNQTTFKSARKTYQFIDYCGDGISKDEVLNPENYSQLHTLVHVIDGTDSTKLGDAGLFLYRMLVSKAFQKRQCNYIIFLNKIDSQNFLSKAKIVKRLQDQIQHIKQSRKNSPEEFQEEEDYLKTTKERFNLERSSIKVVCGAAREGNLKELENVLQEVL